MALAPLQPADRRIDIENEQPFRHEAEIAHRGGSTSFAQEQPRAGQEDQRYGHLRNHEHSPGAAVLTSPACRLEPSVAMRSGSRRLPGGRKAEQDRCRQRNQPDETAEGARRSRREQRAVTRPKKSVEARVGAHPRERDAGGAAECREHPCSRSEVDERAVAGSSRARGARRFRVVVPRRVRAGGLRCWRRR